MLPIDPNHPYDRCGGPSRGCPYCIAIFSESPQRQYERTRAEDRARGLRAAAEHHSASGDFTPPDPYANDLKKLRAELPSPRWPKPATPSSSSSLSENYTPPDPYKPALDKLKGENR